MTTGVVERVADFAGWRESTRRYLLQNTPPSAILWQAAEDSQSFLFGNTAPPPQPARGGAIRLPREFVKHAEVVARHRDGDRWALLYRVAWRIYKENRYLLQIETDDDVRSLAQKQKAVDTDIYKMRAFVRFRRVSDDGGERFVAWYRPRHFTLDANERFFVERFGGMRWAILTPELSMTWDLKKIHYGPGVPRSEAPAEDELDELWRAYYASIYNPARLNLDAMRAQLPVFRWEDLPESRVIPELVRTSRSRTQSMTQSHPDATSKYVPRAGGLTDLREAIRSCDACELCGRATQAVMGEGASAASIVLVGEQPGDEEDRLNRPFVGPAGQLLDSAMNEAGVSRSSIYVTNAVKAFRFEERGKRRIHQTPRPAHIATCRPWLEAEIRAVRPQRIICLGATAAQSVLGRAVQIRTERCQPGMERRFEASVFVTYHPSAILRAPDETTKARLFQMLVEDLKTATADLDGR